MTHKLLVVTYPDDLKQFEMFCYCLKKNWQGSKSLIVVTQQDTDQQVVQKIIDHMLLDGWNVEINQTACSYKDRYTEQQVNKIFYSVHSAVDDVVVFDSKDFVLRPCDFSTFKSNEKYRVTYYLPNKNGLELITDVSENGYVREYTVNTNGCKEGEEIILNPSGEICSKSVYTNGLLNGLYQTWHSNGRLEYQCHCINNRLEGILSRWYENGQIAEQSNYRDGLKEGESILWNKTGSIRKLIQYKNGTIMF